MSQESGPVIESSETIKISDIMVEVDEIMKYVHSFWDKHKLPLTGDQAAHSKKIDDLTTRLYHRMKEDHKKFNNAYPVLLFTFARGIFHRDTVLKYFDDVRRNGLGDDEKQARQLARYTAHAVAELNKARGINVPKKAIKEHKKLVYENIIAIKKDFATAIEEIKKQRSGDVAAADTKRQEREEAAAEEAKKLKEEALKTFRFNNISTTNETFRKSKEEREKQAMN